MHSLICRFSLLFIFSVFVGLVLAEEVANPNFDEHVKPILRQHCLKCHGDDKQEADLNLQAYASLMRGGSGGKVVVAGRASQSLLFQAITNPDDDSRMPPNSPPLDAAKIAMIQKWIDAGVRESSASKSMAVARDTSFKPVEHAGSKPSGPPAMPESLPVIELPNLQRPLPVLSMAVSPWAPLLAVASQQHVRLIHTESQQGLGNLPFPEGVPQVIRFSHDGSILMVAGGRPVQLGVATLFDVKSGKRLTTVGDEVDSVGAADISPDQRLVAIGGSGKVVKVFSTADGSLRFKLDKHTDWITALAFSPDGTKLATADRAGGLHLWDAASGGILLTLAEHTQAIHAVDWRPDSKMLASVSEDGKIIWWDVNDGWPAISKTNAHPPVRPAGVYGRIANGVLSARFDSRGNLVTTGRDRTIRVWGADGSQKNVVTLESGLPICSVIANEGKSVISGDNAGNVRFWTP
jgi:hypothetical protein